VRIGEEFLHKREHLSTIAWLVRLWAYHRDEMPDLITKRDAEVGLLSEAERTSPWLLGEHPELDVALVFSAGHPFPAVSRLANRLAVDYGFAWSYLHLELANVEAAPWTVESFSLPTPGLNEDLVQLWACEATIRGPLGFTTNVTGRAQVHAGYPIYDDDRVVGLKEFLRGKLPCLPAGPWTGASALLGEALCTHNLLVNIGHTIKRRERSNDSRQNP
jgi:hypothetical protein